MGDKNYCKKLLLLEQAIETSLEMAKRLRFSIFTSSERRIGYEDGNIATEKERMKHLDKHLVREEKIQKFFAEWRKERLDTNGNLAGFGTRVVPYQGPAASSRNK